MSWIVTIPTAIAAFFIGYKARHAFAVWLLLALGIGCFLLIPIMPGAAQGPDAMVYLILPLIIPIIVLAPYALGSLIRHIAKQ
ncbi:MAG: hypothetical protein HYW78_04650 [Parcubacteria group bacterium]|nr:hypothetical protein [Parcubacteria group bacterium]